MLRSLMSGVSGVRGHQTYLDVIGNNIANVNTAGYKRSNLTFQDLMYQTSQGATPPMDNSGGVNAKQIGLGVQVSAIEVLHTQGNSQYTGSRTDMAIQGDGYYVVVDGNNKLYTRAGNFTLDSESKLVQAGTGYKLQGFEMVADPNDPTQFNQNSTLSDITIPVGEKLEARETTIVGYRCNLDSGADAYLPMGLMANNFATTAKLAGQTYSVTMSEGTSADAFMTLHIGGETLALKLAGIDSTNGRPQLSSDPVEIAGNTYTVAFDSATGKLTLTNLGNPSDVWSLSLKEQMDYNVIGLSDGSANYSYLAEFTDVAVPGQEGYRTMRLWGEDYKGDMAAFEYTVQVNSDGAFRIPAPAGEDTTPPTMIGGFGGGAFVSISEASGGYGIALTSNMEIVDVTQIGERVGIKPAFVQDVLLGGKRYDITITEGPAGSRLATLKFVDRDNPSNAGTLQLPYDGLDENGFVKFEDAVLNLDGKSYNAVFTPGATAETAGVLTLKNVMAVAGDPNDWTYSLGSLVKMDMNDFNTPGALAGTFRSEFISTGADGYKVLFMTEGVDEPTGRFFEVNAANFRQSMGVVPATERVTIEGVEYDVATSERTSSDNFMRLTFTRVADNATATLDFALAGLDAQDRVRVAATQDLTLPDGTVFFREQIGYDPARGRLTFDNGNPSQSFITETGKYVKFQAVTDNLGNKYLVDFDEAGANAFTMKTWVTGSTYSPAIPAVVPDEWKLPPLLATAATFTIPASMGHPLPRGGVEFTAGGNTYRDNGFGFILDAAGTNQGSINYATGAVVFTPGAVGNITSWGDFANLKIPSDGLPLAARTVEFTVRDAGADTRFRDDGAGGLEKFDTATWTAVAGSIDYRKGEVSGLRVGPATTDALVAGDIVAWNSVSHAANYTRNVDVKLDAGSMTLPAEAKPIAAGSVELTVKGGVSFTGGIVSDFATVATRPGSATVNAGGLPIQAGTVSFRAKLNPGTATEREYSFRDDGSGGIEYWNVGTSQWIRAATGAIPANAASIDYATGAIRNIGAPTLVAAAIPPKPAAYTAVTGGVTDWFSMQGYRYEPSVIDVGTGVISLGRINMTVDGVINVPSSGLPLQPGSVSFVGTVGGTDYTFRDNGAGEIQYWDTGTSTWGAAQGTAAPAVNSTIDYATGEIRNLGVGGTDVLAASNATGWSSTVNPGAENLYTTAPTFTAGNTIIPEEGRPITAGSVSFRTNVGGVQHIFRDDGAGGLEYWDTDDTLGQMWRPAGIWNATLVPAALVRATIDYATGEISGLGAAGPGVDPTAGAGAVAVDNGAAASWSSRTPSETLTYRDDGSGRFQVESSPGTWTTVYDGSAVNYLTGGVAGFRTVTNNSLPLSGWSSDVITAATSSITVPVTKGSERELEGVNQRIANVHNTKLDVYDSFGNPHTLEVSWEKQDSGIWRWRAWLPDSDVSIKNNTGLIRFDSDGKLDITDPLNFRTVPTVEIAFSEIGASNMEVDLDFSGQSFGKDGIEGVTQYGSPFTTKGYYQDGYEMGVMTDFAVGKDGTITGVYSNGQNIPLYRVALGLFANPAGLIKNGDTSFRESSNSGLAQVESPQQGGAGSIIGSTLEMSNVDLTEEFTRLITAQRGFQANARMITTSDQVLEELINIKR